MTTATPLHGVLGTLEIPLGLGLLRLSTEGRPAEAEASEVIRFALDQGIRLLDTADSYALNDGDLHYGEHLVRKALGTLSVGRAEGIFALGNDQLVTDSPMGSPTAISPQLVTLADLMARRREIIRASRVRSRSTPPEPTGQMSLF